MRVAVAQFATSLNVQENLASCIRMIKEAAVCEPSLIVLPEYCNSQFCNAHSSYIDHNQAWNEALSIDGGFLQRIAEQAIKHNCYIVINVTLRRELSGAFQNNKQAGVIEPKMKSSAKSNISVTSCLFSPLGILIHQEDKKTLVGYENDFFISADNLTDNISENLTENLDVNNAEVTTTPVGKLGLLAGSDDMTYKASRDLATGGAQLLCHSMSSFSLDQSNLHGPARASENKVFLASANKVGSLLQQGKSQGLLSQENPSQELLVGIGRSQIISPDGKILAKMMDDEAGFVFADLDLADLARCSIKNKSRPDGTELIKQLRPELYQELTLPRNKILQHNVADSEGRTKVPVTANVAIFATYKSNEQAIEDVCHYIENNLSDIIQLPELFFVEDKKTTDNAQQLAQIFNLSKQLINQVSAVLRPFQYVCTSLVLEGKHQAVLINEHGLFAMQQQLHFCQRYQWTALGDDVNIIELPLEQGNINVAMLTADDANIPEIVKVVALNGIHLLLVPFDIQEPCEVEYSLLSRAAENRICIVAASREKSFTNDLSTDSGNNLTDTKKQNKIKYHKSTGLIANLTTDSILLPQWKSPKFDGYINRPLVKHQYGKITKAVIHPIAACDKSKR